MRSFVVGVLVGFCIALGASGKAQDFIVASGLAWHFEKGKDYNWLTLGAGFEKTVKETVRIAGGFYRNSHRENSAYIAAVWLPLSYAIHDGIARIGLIGGAVTGYSNPLMPVGGLALSYERRRDGWNLIAVPPIAGSEGVLWLQHKTLL